MPRVAYKPMKMTPMKRLIVDRTNEIIRDYADAGLDLTLRQIYYQFISREWFPDDWADPVTGSKNNERSYKKLGDILGDARMAGLIDWNSVTDRTRNLRQRAEWGTPADLIGVCADQFRIDRWKNQPQRCEVWVEKDALVGVLERPCVENGVAYFSCRGYTSMSEIWVAAQRLGRYIKAGQKVTIFHLGDHDPSGVDMTRDIMDRLTLIIAKDLVRSNFLNMNDIKRLDEECKAAGSTSVWPWHVERIALNMDQIERYNPPPNPAKMTDARAKKYVEKYGDESWELDALDPRTIIDLIETSIASVREPTLWEESDANERKGRVAFQQIRDRFTDVEKFLRSKK